MSIRACGARPVAIVSAAGALVLLLALAGCKVASTPSATPSSSAAASVGASSTTTPGLRTTLPTAAGGIPKPNPRLSPGTTFPVTAAQVCVPNYSKSVRSVPDAEKRAVFAEYGIASHAPYSYEVDHLISLELGGSNDIRNLWPEPYAGRGGARAKDVIENRLHAQVCSRQISLATAQAEIVHWWTLPGAIRP